MKQYNIPSWRSPVRSSRLSKNCNKWTRRSKRRPTFLSILETTRNQVTIDSALTWLQEIENKWNRKRKWSHYTSWCDWWERYSIWTARDLYKDYVSRMEESLKQLIKEGLRHPVSQISEFYFGVATVFEPAQSAANMNESRPRTHGSMLWQECGGLNFSSTYSSNAYSTLNMEPINGRYLQERLEKIQWMYESVSEIVSFPSIWEFILRSPMVPSEWTTAIFICKWPWYA
jgi:hypothetical protein